jgi:hypothetical protein
MLLLVQSYSSNPPTQSTVPSHRFVFEMHVNELGQRNSLIESHSVQLISSELSLQSSKPSQYIRGEMQRPFLQVNSFTSHGFVTVKPTNHDCDTLQTIIRHAELGKREFIGTAKNP